MQGYARQGIKTFGVNVRSASLIGVWGGCDRKTKASELRVRWLSLPFWESQLRSMAMDP